MRRISPRAKKEAVVMRSLSRYLTVFLAVVLISGCATTGKRRSLVVVDNLVNADRYYDRHPGFRAAFEFLRTQKLDSLTTGRLAIDGERLYAIVSRDKGRGKAAAKLEAHRKYIDIQYVIAGDEVIGVRPAADCRDIAVAYDATRDIGFFADPPVKWVALPPGTFAIFFPEDAHAPLAGEGGLRKVVVKIAVNW